MLTQPAWSPTTGMTGHAFQFLLLPPGVSSSLLAGSCAGRAFPTRLAAACPRSPVVRVLRRLGLAFRAAACGVRSGELAGRDGLSEDAPGGADHGRDRGQSWRARRL